MSSGIANLVKYLGTYLEYFPQEGQLYWRVKPSRSRVTQGSKAGVVTGNHLELYIQGKRYKVSKLVWLLEFGYLPKTLKHKDGNYLNTCIDNLEETQRVLDVSFPVPKVLAALFEYYKYCEHVGEFRHLDTGELQDARIEGYRVIHLWGRPFMQHRLIWLIHNLNWPEGVLDHLDRNKLNNIITNLRDTDYAGNNLNISIKSNNTSKATGVTYHKQNNKWVVKLRGKYYGSFSEFQDAVQCREQIFQQLMQESNSG